MCECYAGVVVLRTVRERTHSRSSWRRDLLPVMTHLPERNTSTTNLLWVSRITKPGNLRCSQEQEAVLSTIS